MSRLAIISGFRAARRGLSPQQPFLPGGTSAANQVESLEQ